MLCFVPKSLAIELVQQSSLELQLRFLCKYSVNRTISQNPVVQVLGAQIEIIIRGSWLKQINGVGMGGWARMHNAENIVIIGMAIVPWPFHGIKG